MRFVVFEIDGKQGLGVETDDGLHGLTEGAAGYSGTLFALIQSGGTALADAGQVLADAPLIAAGRYRHLPPITEAGKFIAVGLNYRAHTAEGPYEQPDYPTLFARFASSFVGHDQAMIRPKQSEQFDDEGELVAVIGKTAKTVPEADALDYSVGYSVFNKGSIRDFQRRTLQWTPGKNFDGTGGFGPTFVTADALPAGCTGLTLTTRLNGQVVQLAPIDDTVFPVARLVAIISEVLTLNPGDVLITGTPSGVGHARRPQLWMKPGRATRSRSIRLACCATPSVTRTDRSREHGTQGHRVKTMMAIEGWSGANPRPGELGVQSKTGFTIVLPVLAKAKQFYDAFGRDVRDEGNALGL